MSEPFLYFELSTGAGAAEPGVGATIGTGLGLGVGVVFEITEAFEEALDVIIKAELELHIISRTIPPITRGIFDEAAFAGMFDI
jgi:ABC-type nitrate/sulfonate/bicarbonate transport system permease component